MVVSSCCGVCVVSLYSMSGDHSIGGVDGCVFAFRCGCAFAFKCGLGG